MGTWCPNCLDESKLFGELPQKNDHQRTGSGGLGIRTYAKTKEAGFEGDIDRLKKAIGIQLSNIIGPIWNRQTRTEGQGKTSHAQSCDSPIPPTIDH